MATGESKRIIVIKNLSSDLVEEAILILKPQYQVHKSIACSLSGRNTARDKDEILFKEAEDIIRNYINENKLEVLPMRHGPDKAKAVNRKSLISLGINILMISSIALLIYLTIKLF